MTEWKLLEFQTKSSFDMIPIDKLAANIVTWLRDYAAQAGAAGYVIGLSGGIDSACTAVLCQRAQGEHVLGVLMPCHSAPEDASMAHLIATSFALPTVTVDLAPAYDALLATLPPGISALAQANIKTRLESYFQMIEQRRMGVGGP